MYKCYYQMTSMNVDAVSETHDCYLPRLKQAQHQNLRLGLTRGNAKNEEGHTHLGLACLSSK